MELQQVMCCQGVFLLQNVYKMFLNIEAPAQTLEKCNILGAAFCCHLAVKIHSIFVRPYDSQLDTYQGHSAFSTAIKTTFNLLYVKFKFEYRCKEH